MNLIIQGCVAVIIVGVFHSLWMSTKAYGGLIGTAIRLLGLGVLFVVISTIERLLVNFSIIEPNLTLGLAQDLFNLLGLVFLGLGFSKLASATKV